MAGSDTLLRSPTVLWASLSVMRIEQAGARRFEEALADQTGWSLPFAERVVDEYRRFLYLAATAPFEASPSTAVDEAWHLHLTYSRHYWEVLCDRILGRPLHHLPGSGEPGDQARFDDQYLKTLSFYEQSFGAPPPSDIWPNRASAAAAAESLKERWIERHPEARQRMFVGSGLLALAAFSLLAFDQVALAVLALFLALLLLIYALPPLKLSPPPHKQGASGSNCGGFVGFGDGGGCDSAGCGSSCGGGD